MPKIAWAFQEDENNQELVELVHQLDEVEAQLDKASVDFIADVLDREIKRFSERQEAWIRNLAERYL